MKDQVKSRAVLVAGMLACAILLAGCIEGNTKSLRPVQPEPVVVHTGRQAPILEKLDKRFESSDTHFELGQSYRNDGVWTKAEYHFKSSISFDPTNRAAQAALTRVLIDRGKMAKADAGAGQYVKQAGYSLKDTMKLAEAFKAERLTQYAVVCYRQAVDKWPSSADGYRELGNYYLGLGDEAAAKEYFKRSFRLDPTQSQVATELGRMGVIVKVPRDSGGSG